MSNIDIPLAIQYAQVGQYELANKYAKEAVFKGVNLTPYYISLLRTIRETVEDQYSINGDSAALEWLANYMVALSGVWPINTTPAATPLTIIVQPMSQTVNAGDNVLFSVSATGGVPGYTYIWYFNNSAIVGETNPTLTLNAVTSGNAGGYKVKITDSAGNTVTSNTVALAVNAALLTADWWWGDTDPWPDISGGTDNLTYLGSVNFTAGGPIVIPWPAASANNKYRVVRYPVTEGDIVSWVNIVGFNYGPVPGTAYNPIATITTKKYVVSKGDSVQSPYSVTYSE